MTTKIARRDPTLPPLVPECEWNVPEPVRAMAPDYESYEVVDHEEPVTRVRRDRRWVAVPA